MIVMIDIEKGETKSNADTVKGRVQRQTIAVSRLLEEKTMDDRVLVTHLISAVHVVVLGGSGFDFVYADEGH